MGEIDRCTRHLGQVRKLRAVVKGHGFEVFWTVVVNDVLKRLTTGFSVVVFNLDDNFVATGPFSQSHDGWFTVNSLTLD